jgi:DNA-binding transcriptional ArsR family regulator
VTTNEAGVLTALADPTRRAIFEMVARRPRAVAELARELPVSRPAVSQHLKVLKEATLVRDRPEGTRRIYTVDPRGLAAVRDYFEQFWRTSLDSFREAAERTQQPEQE